MMDSQRHVPRWVAVLMLAAFLFTAPPATSHERAAVTSEALYPALQSSLSQRMAEFDRIPPARQAQLRELSAYINERRADDQPVRLLFVCTHNSRRSHMAQLWTAAAAMHFDITIMTYSGGTEATAFNPRAVAALQRAGFEIERTTDDANPIYHVRLAEHGHPLTCFSKAYDHAPNPKDGFAAVMVCGEADEACPSVPGAVVRVAIPYVDPKISDNTPEEAATYDERGAQIAREMLYVMQQASINRDEPERTTP
jgi:arsenate reductase